MKERDWMERHGEIIRIKQDKLEEYKYYHAMHGLK